MLSYADFADRLGQHFRIQLDGIEPIDLELVSAREVGEPGTSAGGQRRPYSLLFLGPESTHYLQQHTYWLHHTELGDLDMFIVPIGPDGMRMRYESIFT